jgi:release factor glutamine methyltransferase
MTVEQAYKTSLSYLQRKLCPTPDVDVRAIMGHYLRINRNEIFLHKNEFISFFKMILISFGVFRRGRLEPIAAILGYQYFFQDKFLVSRKTLIPRADTEHLLYAAKESGKEFGTILDIGTGTGALALSLFRLFPKARILGIDIQISLARKNALNLGIKNVKWQKQDFLKFKPGPGFEKQDLIISNPPYLSEQDFEFLDKEAKLYEPFQAFYGGKDGLDFYKKIAEIAQKILAENGMIIVEVDHKWREIETLFRKAGFNKIEIKKDYQDLERVLIAHSSFS